LAQGERTSRCERNESHVQAWITRHRKGSTGGIKKLSESAEHLSVQAAETTSPELLAELR
jgi:hypothetical protein